MNVDQLRSWVKDDAIAWPNLRRQYRAQVDTLPWMLHYTRLHYVEIWIKSRMDELDALSHWSDANSGDLASLETSGLLVKASGHNLQVLYQALQHLIARAHRRNAALAFDVPRDCVDATGAPKYIADVLSDLEDLGDYRYHFEGPSPTTEALAAMITTLLTSP